MAFTPFRIQSKSEPTVVFEPSNSAFKANFFEHLHRDNKVSRKLTPNTINLPFIPIRHFPLKRLRHNMGTKNLNNAKKAKNDEFYTQLSDIENELQHYKEHLKDKIIFCNCDDPEWSNFWTYFYLNFKSLGLKGLISTHYEQDKPSYKMEWWGEVDEDGQLITTTTPLKGNGDFRSPEVIELLKQADVVVTNPPFSLFREYIAQLMECDKSFLIIGNINAISYKEVFPHIASNKLWLGINTVRRFVQPSGDLYEAARTYWFTNLPHSKRNEEIILYQTYEGNEENYPKYDNYDAIEVSKTKDIPLDYKGYMGVPITFLDKYNPNQFEIIGSFNNGEHGRMLGAKKVEAISGGKTQKWAGPVVNKKPLFKRVIIKRKFNNA